MVSAMFYIFTGLVLLIFAVGLHYFLHTPGFQYLSIGFFMFCIYSVGKGILMYIVSRKRFLFYLKKQSLNNHLLGEEITYTDFRIKKKQTNRRIYMYITIFSCFIAFWGIFSPYKSIMMGTAIPVALISSIEFSIGLLNEFRLREYFRILQKNN